MSFRALTQARQALSKTIQALRVCSEAKPSSEVLFVSESKIYSLFPGKSKIYNLFPGESKLYGSAPKRIQDLQSVPKRIKSLRICSQANPRSTDLFPSESMIYRLYPCEFEYYGFFTSVTNVFLVATKR